jgi:hypothetical protein
METWTTFNQVVQGIKDNPHPKKKKSIQSVFNTRKDLSPIKDYLLSSFQHEKYTNPDFEYTLKYCFERMMRFLFVQIRSGKVVTFAHVENTKFRNNWSSHLKTTAKTLRKRLSSFSKDTRKCRVNRIEEDATKWSATNCFVNPYSYSGDGVGDSHYEKELYDMLQECAKKYKLPDTDLIINKKDSNFLRWDDKYPYDVYRSEKDPAQVGHHFYPILAIGSSIHHADIPIPYPQDWDLPKPIQTPWSQREPRAVFRGASTGCGVEENQRIRAAQLSMKFKSQGKDILDAGITKENCRLRVVNKELDWIKMKKLNIPIVPFMTREDQSKFKYILHIDGNIAAFRLSEDLQSGSTVLKVQGPYTVWFSPLLKEYEHYVPIKADLSDLEEKIMWCREHDSECQLISQKAEKLIKSIVTHERILQYWKYVIDLCGNEN